jgi:hypothetical protein
MLQLTNWCKADNRLAVITDNLFLDSPLYDAAQILNASSQAMIANYPGFAGYYNEIYQYLDILTSMGR